MISDQTSLDQKINLKEHTIFYKLYLPIGIGTLFN